MRNRRTLVGLGVIVVFTAVSVVASSTGSARITSGRVWRSDAIKWGVAALLVLIVVFWEEKPLRSIGMSRPSWRDLFWGVVTALIAVLATNVVGGLLAGIFHLEATTGALSALQSFSFGQRVEIVAAAGVTEEVLYRGYPIERLERLTGSTALAATLPTLLFVGVHLPAWGIATGVNQLLETLFFVGLYLWRRSLPACIVMHLVIDGLGIVLLPVFTG